MRIHIEVDANAVSRCVRRSIVNALIMVLAVQINVSAKIAKI